MSLGGRDIFFLLQLLVHGLDLFMHGRPIVVFKPHTDHAKQGAERDKPTKLGFETEPRFLINLHIQTFGLGELGPGHVHARAKFFLNALSDQLEI